MHVAVVDPAVHTPELDVFNRMSRRSRLPLTYHLPALFGLDDLRRAEEGLAGIVVFGSGASAQDDPPWAPPLRAWLERHLDRVPVLGLCYGHQILAQILGGEVGYVAPDRRKLVGRREVALRADRLWGDARRVPLLISHREEVKRLPGSCVVLGTSPDCAIDAFGHRELPIWGFQPHPEATPAFARNNDVPVEGDPSLWAHGHALVDAFLDAVADGL